MRLRRVVIWIAASTAVLLLLLGATAFAFFRTFYPSPPEAQFPPTADLKMAQQHDREYFQHYLGLNRSFSPQARSRLLQLLEQNQANAGTFTPAQFSLAVAEMAALAVNGHSRIGPGRLARSHTHLPCRLYRFADGYYVIRARAACVELLGAKVLQIDGQPIEAIADAMYRYFSGPRNHYDQYASPFFIASRTRKQNEDTHSLLTTDSWASQCPRLTERLVGGDLRQPQRASAVKVSAPASQTR